MKTKLKTVEVPVHRHTFAFNQSDNGGQHLVLVTKWYPNGDPGGTFTNQEIVLYSYCNSASINLSGTSINPENLRKLADELEEAQKKAHNKMNDEKDEKPVSGSLYYKVMQDLKEREEDGRLPYNPEEVYGENWKTRNGSL